MNSREAKNILMIDGRYKIGDPNAAKVLVNYLETNRVCQSEDAVAFFDAFKDYSVRGAYIGNCFCCGKFSDNIGNLLCSECVGRLNSIVSSEQNDKTNHKSKKAIQPKKRGSEKPESNPNNAGVEKKGNKLHKKIVVVYGGIALAIILALVLLITTKPEIFRSVDISVSDTNAEETIEGLISDVDGLEYIGASMDLLSENLNSSPNEISANIYMYDNAGVSIITENDAKQIKYIDCTCTGVDGFITVAGIYPSEKYENVEEYLKNKEIGYEYDAGSDSLLFEVPSKGKTINVQVTFLEGEVVSVSARLRR